jgi:ABC-type spermidine/putrescine transport system permease subunit I
VAEPAPGTLKPGEARPGSAKPGKAKRSRHQTAMQSSALWPLLAVPGTVWLILFFLAPMYVVLTIVFGRVDPVFRTPLPVWNPLQWNPAQFNYVFSHIVGKDGFFGPALLRTLVFVLLASVICLLVAYPVAYFTARFAGKRKGLILTLLIAPFWISYMMRMLAWVNLLQNDGLVNRGLSLDGVFHVNVDWLSGRTSTVLLGLVYGYVPYMILPLFAGLDRIQGSVLEAARDLGAGRLSTFWRVTWRLSLPAVVASVLLSCLPMLGDYFTNDLLSASPGTSMVGNLINNSALAPGQTGQAGAFVLLVLVVSILPMLWYVRTTRDDGARS